jgi:hypothetical protein
MKIVVIGGRALIGPELVERLGDATLVPPTTPDWAPRSSRTGSADPSPPPDDAGACS